MAIKYKNYHPGKRLERLFMSDSFNKAIADQRKKIGMLKGGFSSFEEWVSWIEKKSLYDELYLFRSDVYSFSQGLARRFDLPFNYGYWIEAYLVLGEQLRDYKIEPPPRLEWFQRWYDLPPGSCCAIKFNDTDMNVDLKIFPGATIGEITSFVRKHKDFIKGMLSLTRPSVSEIRKRRKKKTDAVIYALHKNGCIRSIGVMVTSKEHLIPEEIKRMTAEAKKRAILRGNRLRKSGKLSAST